MNALIFTENNDLKITKTNGLRYEFNNVDKPSLGFDFDIIVYDGDEHWRIEKFDDSQDFETHERIDLTDEEMVQIIPKELMQDWSWNVQMQQHMLQNSWFRKLKLHLKML